MDGVSRVRRGGYRRGLLIQDGTSFVYTFIRQRVRDDLKLQALETTSSVKQRQCELLDVELSQARPLTRTINLVSRVRDVVSRPRILHRLANLGPAIPSGC